MQLNQTININLCPLETNKYKIKCSNLKQGVKLSEISSVRSDSSCRSTIFGSKVESSTLCARAPRD